MSKLETLAKKYDASQISPGMNGGTVAFIRETEYGDSMYLEDREDDGDVWVIVELNGGVAFTKQYSEVAFKAAEKFADKAGI